MAAVTSAYRKKNLCTVYMLRAGEPPGGKSMGTQVCAQIQSWSCRHRWVICFSNANNIAVVCRSSWKRAGVMQVFLWNSENNACVLTQVIILQVRKTVISLLLMYDWEWRDFCLFMYFSRQQCVAGVYKSWGCKKIPFQSEYVPVAVTPIPADF